MAIIFAINRKRDPKRTRKLAMAAACFFLRISKKKFFNRQFRVIFALWNVIWYRNLMKKVKKTLKLQFYADIVSLLRKNLCFLLNLQNEVIFPSNSFISTFKSAFVEMWLKYDLGIRTLSLDLSLDVKLTLDSH